MNIREEAENKCDKCGSTLNPIRKQIEDILYFITSGPARSVVIDKLESLVTRAVDQAVDEAYDKAADVAEDYLLRQEGSSLMVEKEILALKSKQDGGGR